jgi:cytochrome P450
MSFEELHETCSVLIAAGSEMSATLLSGVTYYLLTSPLVLKKLTRKIRGVFKSEAEIAMVSANSLSYELAVLNEALRIYPPANGDQPQVTPPEGCTIAGRFVPGNTCVGIPQWSANHSSINFRHPHNFVPERWTGDPEFKDDKKKVAQPFGYGPRNCIGRSLAYTEMRVILARVIWNFDMELCEESKSWGTNLKVFFYEAIFDGEA